MSLHRPWLTLVAAENGAKEFVLRHNCNGGVSFSCTEVVDEKVGRWLQLAIEEGKRQRSRELFALLKGE